MGRGNDGLPKVSGQKRLYTSETPALNLVFENDFFVIVDKPALTLSVPSRMGEEDARRCVGTELQKQMGQQIYPVHRLDFEVSGLLAFAKTAEAHRWANQAFEGREVQKTYTAVAPAGATDPSVGKVVHWKDLLVRGKKRSFVAPHGKEAWTEARCLGVHSGNSKWRVWELRPHTGRSHQLRVHMSLYVQPLVGDELYGSQEKWPRPGIALRAASLEFPAGNAFGLPARLQSPQLPEFQV